MKEILDQPKNTSNQRILRETKKNKNTNTL
jgi:hypothetical protein